MGLPRARGWEHATVLLTTSVGVTMGPILQIRKQTQEEQRFDREAYRAREKHTSWDQGPLLDSPLLWGFAALGLLKWGEDNCAVGLSRALWAVEQIP